MVGLDNSRLTETTFDHVRIDCALYKEINGTDLLRFFFEDTDKFFTNNLTFRFRFCNTLQFVIISLLCIDTDKVQFIRAIRAENSFNFIALVLAQKTMVNKHTCQLFADRFGQKNCCNGGINTAG